MTPENLESFLYFIPMNEYVHGNLNDDPNGKLFVIIQNLMKI